MTPILGRALALAILLAPAASAASARGAAPQPAKIMDLGQVVGRWYEIARTPNPNQRDCQAATSDWIQLPGGRYEIVQTCRKGSPEGPARVMKASAVLVDAVNNAKWKLSFMGGLIRQEYWLVDQANDHSWMLFGTPGGNYVWILSRQPVMSEAAKAEAVGRCRQLGYDVAKLVFPAQAGG